MKRLTALILAVIFSFTFIPVIAAEEEQIVKINEGVVFSVRENAVQLPGGGASLNSTGVLSLTSFGKDAANFANRRVGIIRFDLSEFKNKAKLPDCFYFSFGTNDIFSAANYKKIAEDNVTFSLHAIKNLNDTWAQGNTMANMLESGSTFDTELIGTITSDGLSDYIQMTTSYSAHRYGYNVQGGGTQFSDYIKTQINNGNYVIDILLEASDKENNPSAYLGLFVIGSSMIYQNPQYINASGTPTYLDAFKTSIRYYDIKKSEVNTLKSVNITNGLLSEEFNPDAVDNNTDKLQKTYKIGVIDEAKDVKLTYTLTSKKSTVTDAVTTGNMSGVKTLKVPVTSEAGVTKTYIFELVPASELGYTEDGKLETESLSYDKTSLTSNQLITISAELQNNSLSLKKAALVSWYIKDNKIIDQKINVYDNINPGPYSLSYGINSGSADEIVTFISDISDDNNKDTILVPISDVIGLSKLSKDILKKENLIEIYYKDIAKSEVTVSGKWTEKNQSIGAYIVTKGTKISDFGFEYDDLFEEYTIDKAKDFFVYAGAMNTDANGYYGFDSAMPGTNDYEIIIIDNKGNTESYEFYFASPLDKENALKDLYEDKSKASLKNKLNISLTEEEREKKVTDGDVKYNYIKLLALSLSEFSNGVNEDEFLEILSGLMTESSDYTEFLTLYEDSLILEKINSGLVSDITEYKDRANLSEDIVYIYEGLTEEQQTDISENKLSKYGFKDLDEINDAFTKELLWVTVSSLKNIEKLKDIITDYSSELGLDEFIDDFDDLNSAGKKEVIEAVADGAPYSSDDKLKDVFEEAIEDAQSEEGSSGGGGSSRPSSGGSGSNQAINVSGTITGNSDLSSDVINNQRVCRFNDLTGFEWAEQAIKNLYENRVIDGVSETAFNPGGEVKREEFVKMIDTLYAGNSVATVFSDVNINEWYAPYVSKATGSGIIKGMSENLFGTGYGVTREDMAVMIYRLLKPTEELTGEAFADDSVIADYAKEAVYYLKNKGIISGTGNGNYEPKRIMTRAEAAVLINNILNVVNE